MIEHLKGRERALAALGWTGREAEWIALVCLHSGVFTRAQFCHYFEARPERGPPDCADIGGSRAVSKAIMAGSTEAGSRAGFQASRSTGRSELRTSATGEKLTVERRHAAASLA